jgi:hypothetical protein
VSGETTDLFELRARVLQASASATDVEQFADQAMAEIDKVHARLAFAETLVERLERAAVPQAALIERQASLLVEQSDQLIALQRRLEAVTALCDLAEWSVQTAGDGQRSAVLVDELRRVLA